VVLLDHIAALEAAAIPRRGSAPSVTLLTSASGEPFYIHVFQVARRGHDPTFAVTVRSSGADVVAFRRRYRLSARESQIVELVCRGAANRDIARSLGIAVTTAKKHLGRIFDKVGVDSRAQLMAKLG
jgi:DNA-binding CsgD family transcriptional regulator